MIHRYSNNPVQLQKPTNMLSTCQWSLGEPQWARMVWCWRL